MRVTDEMVMAALDAEQNYPPHHVEGIGPVVSANAAMRAALEAALAVEGTPEPVAWRHKYTDPGSGKPVWRDRGGLWNGQLPEESQPLYTTPPAGIREALEELPDYDAGLLNDYGGGNVEWWWDYLRAEIDRANGYWRAALRGQS